MAQSFKTTMITTGSTTKLFLMFTQSFQFHLATYSYDVAWRVIHTDSYPICLTASSSDCIISSVAHPEHSSSSASNSLSVNSAAFFNRSSGGRDKKIYGDFLEIKQGDSVTAFELNVTVSLLHFFFFFYCRLF